MMRVRLRGVTHDSRCQLGAGMGLAVEEHVEERSKMRNSCCNNKEVPQLVRVQPDVKAAGKKALGKVLGIHQRPHKVQRHRNAKEPGLGEWGGG